MKVTVYYIVSYHGRGSPCGAIRIGMDVVVTLMVRGGEDEERFLEEV